MAMTEFETLRINRKFRRTASDRWLERSNPLHGLSIRQFDLLDSWNFCWDAPERTWYWNPSASSATHGTDPTIVPVPEGLLVSVRRPRAIDRPALLIHIRDALGERNWGRFLERFGIPPAIITMPENADEKLKAKYEEATGGLGDGRHTVLPYGSTVSWASEARGVNPFIDFVKHQERQIVLMATGGTLTSLAESGTGTLAGNAQMDVWDEIVARDARIIGGAVDGAVVRPYLESVFPGREIAVSFELGHDAEPTPAEVFADAAAAKSGGYVIAQADLEEKTGYTLERDTQAPLGDGGPTGGLPGMNAAADEVARIVPNPQPARNAVEDPEPPATDSKSVLDAFIHDATPAAEAVKKLMEDPTAEAAKDLMDRLPDLIGDQALAAVIAEAMAEEMAKAAGETDGAANMRQYKRETDGKFAEVDHPRDFNPGINPDSSTAQAAQIGKGKKALEKCLREKCDVHDAVSRGDIGSISFVYGDGQMGVQHFKSRTEATRRLSETLVRGEAGKPYQGGGKVNIDHGGYRATLRLTSPDGKSSDKWVLTTFGPNDQKEGTAK